MLFSQSHKFLSIKGLEVCFNLKGFETDFAFFHCLILHSQSSLNLQGLADVNRYLLKIFETKFYLYH